MDGRSPTGSDQKRREVTAGGTIDLHDATFVGVSTFILAAAGNSLHLSGQDGNYTITGGGGAGTLSGGTGADEFVYTATGEGGDTITNFGGSTGQGDRLQFVDLRSGDFVYRGASAFTATGNSEARFNGSALLVDTNSNGTADLTLILTGITAAGQLSAADFSWV